jgi:hypothetical protein
MAAYDDALFRSQFPEFADTTTYPEALLSGYWDMATNFINPSDSGATGTSSCGCPYNFQILNGNSLALALNYMTAQLLTLGQQALANGTPGSDQGGFIVSAKIGEIIIAKLPPPAANAWQWWLGQTPYGQALLAMLQVLSVGGLSFGGLNERGSFRKGGGLFW